MNMRAVNLLRRRVVSQPGSLLGTFEVMDAEDMGYKCMTDDVPALKPTYIYTFTHTNCRSWLGCVLRSEQSYGNG